MGDIERMSQSNLNEMGRSGGREMVHDVREVSCSLTDTYIGKRKKRKTYRTYGIQQRPGTKHGKSLNIQEQVLYMVFTQSIHPPGTESRTVEDIQRFEYSLTGPGDSDNPPLFEGLPQSL